MTASLSAALKVARAVVVVVWMLVGVHVFTFSERVVFQGVVVFGPVFCFTVMVARVNAALRMLIISVSWLIIRGYLGHGCGYRGEDST